MNVQDTQEMDDALDDVLNVGDLEEGHEIDSGEPMQLDDTVGMHWQGDSAQDMQEMDGALEDILNL
ncbi:hypothetical protein J4E85_011540 [Alternaria conjuncta]|uniref:uncharacterized protein n=1 Tax=Alternaria conjuncta TaxID=181017 RepID=UPI002220B817|nr:uncharacterized protein J4E85_011540 [Alternaria conjuncta]KAI4909718.1 hypothetical protein J4E85_011540 [Alternaria conjuncta]